MSTTPEWRKSSRSGGQGGQCVEVATFTGAQWRKSSQSDGQEAACVEVTGTDCDCGAHARVIAVRDSKNPDGAALGFAPAEWAHFLTAVKQDHFTA